MKTVPSVYTIDTIYLSHSKQLAVVYIKIKKKNQCENIFKTQSSFRLYKGI